jgi:polyene macrolide polyketide synthase
MPALSVEEGVALFDASLATDRPMVMPTRLDLAILRAGGGEIPALLQGLIRTKSRRVAGGALEAADTLLRRLAGLGEDERREVLLDLTRSNAAAVLGHADSEAITAGRQFQDLGFDSLTAVEFRNKMNSVTGLRLPATLLFDYPTPTELVDYVAGELVLDAATGPASILDELDRLAKTLTGMTSVDPKVHKQVAGRLEVLRAKWASSGDEPVAQEDFDFDSASDDEVFALLDDQLSSDPGGPSS